MYSIQWNEQWKSLNPFVFHLPKKGAEANLKYPGSSSKIGSGSSQKTLSSNRLRNTVFSYIFLKLKNNFF